MVSCRYQAKTVVEYGEISKKQRPWGFCWLRFFFCGGGRGEEHTLGSWLGFVGAARDVRVVHWPSVLMTMICRGPPHGL